MNELEFIRNTFEKEIKKDYRGSLEKMFRQSTIRVDGVVATLAINLVRRVDVLAGMVQIN